nr:DUF2262 domain-containing protein [uncultured Carboxylicivirga sp.]
MKNLFNKLRLSKKEDDNDTFIGIVSEDGVVKSSFMDDCSMSFTFIAYTKNDSKVLDEEIYVTKKIASIETEIKGIEPLTVIKITGKQFKHHEQKRIELKKVLKSKVDQRELNEILVKRQEPVIYESSTLGKFRLDRRLDWYEGKTDWNGISTDIFLAGELENIEKIETNAISIIKDQAEWDSFIKGKICEELLVLKNENWLEEDEKPFTAEEFTSTIFLESITVNDSDVFQMCFNDGDIFWGHAITVETDLNKNIEHIGIAG